MLTSRAIGGLLLVLICTLCASADDQAAGKKRLLLIGQGPDGHPPTTHEFAAGLHVLAKCLAPIEHIEVRTTIAKGAWTEGPKLVGESDGVVLFVSEGAKFVAADPRRQEAFTKLAARGGGLAGLHWGIGCKDPAPIEAFLKLLGGCHGGPDRRYKVTDVRLQPVVGNPITAGIAALDVHDEFYYRLKFVDAQPGVRPVATASLDGRDETVAWSWQRPDGGRSFGFSGLHFHDNWRHEAYRRLVTQGVLWTLKVEIPATGVAVAVDDEDLKLKPVPAAK
jgi:type 1 glutamine amidotransferase